MTVELQTSAGNFILLNGLSSRSMDAVNKNLKILTVA